MLRCLSRRREVHVGNAQRGKKSSPRHVLVEFQCIRARELRYPGKKTPIIGCKSGVTEFLSYNKETQKHNSSLKPLNNDFQLRNLHQSCQL